jgi:hypothetical protein
LQSTGDWNWSKEQIGPPHIAMHDLDYIRIENACFDYEKTEALNRAASAFQTDDMVRKENALVVTHSDQTDKHLPRL